MTQSVFHCNDCAQQFTVQHPASQFVPTHAACPHCGSANLHLLATAPSSRSFTTAPSVGSRSKQAKARQPRQPRRHKAY